MSSLPADVVMSRVHIERLSFAPEQPYSAIEAAIHLNRYMLVREFCNGKRVLDAGCGEGYGSFLMAERWGAAAVTALDISQSTIDVAGRRFASSRIIYECGECETLDQKLDGQQFDVIVALETIEHLRDPAAFLRAAQRVLAPGGVIVLSCPNDHWYYRDSRESNPFHVRKFHFDEFRELTEGVLGRAVGYLIGAPVAGYSNVAFDSKTVVPDAESMRQLLDAGPVASLKLPADESVGTSNCAYFVGVWGPEGTPMPLSATVFPVSLDNSGLGVRAAQVQNLQDEVVSLRQRIFDFGKQIDDAKTAREKLIEAAAKAERLAGMRYAAIVAEAEFLREELQLRNASLHEAQHHNQQLREHVAVEEQRASGALQRVAEMEQQIRVMAAERAILEQGIAERDAYIRETMIAKVKRVGGKVVRKVLGKSKPQ
ncbi:MAG: methyltransferase domain-containing protein [Phycisphaerae bacterium]